MKISRCLFIVGMAWACLAFGEVTGRGTPQSVDGVPVDEFIETELGTLQKLRLEVRGQIAFKTQKPAPIKVTVPHLMGVARNSWQGCYFLYQDKLGNVFAQHIGDARFGNNKGPFIEVGTVGSGGQLNLGEGYKLGAMVYVEVKPGLAESLLMGARPSESFYIELVGEALSRQPKVLSK